MLAQNHVNVYQVTQNLYGVVERRGERGYELFTGDQFEAMIAGAKFAAERRLPLHMNGQTWYVADEELEAMRQHDLDVDEAQGEGMSYVSGPVWA